MELELSEFWHILGLCNKYHDWVTVPGYRSLNSRLCVGFQIRDRDLKNQTSETQNHPKTKFRDPSRTLPRFRDQAKIFRDPRYSRNHSTPSSLSQLHA